MGLVRFGGLVTQVSGAIAGVVHARNRFGNYIRPRTKPVNPHSQRQEQVRADLSHLAEVWHGEMSAAQRAAWEVYAAAVAMKNRLGETIHLTGYNHFMRVAMAFRNYSESVPSTAPAILSLPEKDPMLTCSAEDIAAQTFTFTCNPEDWPADGETKLAMFIYQGLPQLASRNSFAGPWRYMDMFDATEGAAGTGTYDAAFPFGLGQKVWFKARLLTVSSRLSEQWYTAPKIIEADV